MVTFLLEIQTNSREEIDGIYKILGWAMGNFMTHHLYDKKMLIEIFCTITGWSEEEKRRKKSHNKRS